MNKNFKIYKLCKIKTFIKKHPLILISHTLNLNSYNWLKIEQKLINSNLKYYKIKNTVTRQALTNSIFLNILPALNGSLCLIYPKNKKKFDENFQALIEINKTMPVFALKLNKKIYSKNQLSNVSTLSYEKNIKILNKTLKNFIKTPYYKLKISK